MPPAKSPLRKRGTMISSMIRFEVASVSTPSRPYPTSMRSSRSSLATMSSAPSSTPLRPSFHASTTLIEYCSIASGFVVGTISTATCAPLRCSKSVSFCSSAPFCDALRVEVRSVTCAVSGGTATSATANAHHSRLSTRPETRATSRASCIGVESPAELLRLRFRHIFVVVIRGLVRLLRLVVVEVHGRRLADGGLVLNLQRRLDVVAEHHRREIRRELAHGDVVILHGVDVAVARDGDAILRAFELRLQIAEVL